MNDFRVMVFNTTFNNVSVIVVVSFIGEGNRSTWRKPPTCHKSLTNFIILSCIEYSSPSAGLEVTTPVVIGTDCIGSCKSNYHAFTTTTVRKLFLNSFVCLLLAEVELFVMWVFFFSVIKKMKIDWLLFNVK